MWLWGFSLGPTKHAKQNNEVKRAISSKRIKPTNPGKTSKVRKPSKLRHDSKPNKPNKPSNASKSGKSSKPRKLKASQASQTEKAKPGFTKLNLLIFGRFTLVYLFLGNGVGQFQRSLARRILLVSTKYTDGRVWKWCAVAQWSSGSVDR